MYRWSLSALYLSFESEEYRQDLKRLDYFKKVFSTIELVENKETIHRILSYLEAFTVCTGRLSAYIGLTLSADQDHEEAKNQEVVFRQKMADLKKELVRLYKFLGQVDMSSVGEEDRADYAYFFECVRKERGRLLSDEEEDIIGRLSISGGKAWEQLFYKMTSGVEGVFQGKPITLSEIRNFAYDEDGETRRAAYLEEIRMYETIKEPIAFALNNIKAEVNTVTKLRGYTSALEQSLEASHMEKETLDALMAAIKDHLPDFHEYFRHKASLLGYAGGLPFYDLFAPLGRAGGKKYTVEESRVYLTDIFRKFSPDMAEMTEEFYEKGYIDFMPRKGKVGGAFCENLPYIKQSRILTNFSGSFSDIVTLAHELGHAYHGMVIEAHKPLNWQYSMPLAETASTFNENIVIARALEAADKEDKITLLESQIADLAQIIVDIYSRFLFESEVFEKGKTAFLPSKELEKIMEGAQEAAYGEGVDPAWRHPFMWACKPHYYSTEESFYNFPYAFGGLFARGLYSIYRKEAETFPARYKELLMATTVSSVEDTAGVMGIDLRKKEFWDMALNQVKEEIRLFINLTQEEDKK